MRERGRERTPSQGCSGGSGEEAKFVHYIGGKLISEAIAEECEAFEVKKGVDPLGSHV